VLERCELPHLAEASATKIAPTCERRIWMARLGGARAPCRNSAATAIALWATRGTLLDVGMDDTWSAFHETKFDPLLGLDFSNVLGDALCTER
jgi:hypothetical protein